jgi:hypothetical protein
LDDQEVMFVQIKAGIKAVHPVPGFVRDNRLATIISYWDRGLHLLQDVHLDIMPTQTVTRSAESDLEPGKLYNVLAEASNIPKWAPAFADAIQRIDQMHHRVTKNGKVFNLEVSLHPSAVAVDYTREMPNGKRGGAYIRVTPRPLGGSTITMTVPIGPNTTESDVAKVLEQELADLVQLAQF